MPAPWRGSVAVGCSSPKSGARSWVAQDESSTMCSGEALQKWSHDSSTVKGKGNGAVDSSKSGALSVYNLRVTTKDYVPWHSRIRGLIFARVLFGTCALFGVTTILHNAVEYLGNPESGLFAAGFTALPQIIPNTAAASDSHERSFERTSFTASVPTSVDNELAEEAPNPSVAEGADGADQQELMTRPVDLKRLSDVYHDMHEAELLRRASADALRRPRPDSIAPKVAYMFLTRGPLPLAPLWERYFKGHGRLYNIYIHAHPNYMPDFLPDSVFYRRNIPSKEVFWGKLSVFAAERRLLANALLDAANERFVLLSESCVPVTPLPSAYKYFTESHHSFVEAYFHPGKGGMGRYTRIKRRDKLNPEVAAAQWRKGSQWFEMSRELALLVVSDRKYYPKLGRFLCVNDCVCYMDEHYLPTTLTILAPSKLANRTAHFIDFTRSTAHPRQWNRDAINEATLRAITTGHNCTYNGKVTQTCHMFSRKFSSGTLEPLLELAATSFGIP